MSEANTPKSSVCALLVKLYKMLFCFAVGTLVSDMLNNNNKKFQLASGLTRILYSWFLLNKIVIRTRSVDSTGELEACAIFHYYNIYEGLGFLVL